MYLIKSAFFAVKYNYVHTRIFVFFSVVVRVSLDIAKLLPTNFLTILRIVNSAKKVSRVVYSCLSAACSFCPWQEAGLAAEHEASLRQQLRRQAAAYSDHLAEVLRVQAAELEGRLVMESTARKQEVLALA